MSAAKYDNNDGRLRGRHGTKRRLRLWTASPTCAMCKRLTEYPFGFHVDHIVPLFKGGPDEDENLQVLCIKCHDVKTEKDMGFKPAPKFGPDGRVQW